MISVARRQSELKYGAARFIRFDPQPAAMGIDYGTADRKPHPDATGFRGVKCIENAFQTRRINAG